MAAEEKSEELFSNELRHAVCAVGEMAEEGGSSVAVIKKGDR